MVRRIRRTEALCLRTVDHRESSRIVTLFALEDGRFTGVAKGARRPKSKFGAALDRLAVSNVIYYWHQQKTIYTISDAVLARSFPGLARDPNRFLAAEQVAEFLLRSLHAHDAHPQLYRLTVAYLAELETRDRGFGPLVGSYLLKAASFLGFRPELRRCLRCKRAVEAEEMTTFDLLHGGVYCSRCKEPGSGGMVLEPGPRQELVRLLHTPVAELGGPEPGESLLELIIRYVSSHIDPLLLNSFRWKEL